jgi:hypothetical protein
VIYHRIVNRPPDCLDICRADWRDPNFDCNPSTAGNSLLSLFKGLLLHVMERRPHFVIAHGLLSPMPLYRIPISKKGSPKQTNTVHAAARGLMCYKYWRLRNLSAFFALPRPSNGRRRCDIRCIELFVLFELRIISRSRPARLWFNHLIVEAPRKICIFGRQRGGAHKTSAAGTGARPPAGNRTSTAGAGTTVGRPISWSTVAKAWFLPQAPSIDFGQISVEY